MISFHLKDETRGGEVLLERHIVTSHEKALYSIQLLPALKTAHFLFIEFPVGSGLCCGGPAPGGEEGGDLGRVDAAIRFRRCAHINFPSHSSNRVRRRNSLCSCVLSV